MNKPKVIYLCENPITKEAEPFWLNTQCDESDVAYFSKENVEEILKQVVDDANSLISCARRSAVFTSKLDADKYIPHVIDLLKA